jgi:hypothetical protein
MESTFKSAESAISGSVTSMLSSIMELGPAALAAAGALLAFEGVKSAVEAALQCNEGLLSLSRTMGITTEAAATLSAALGIIGASTEGYMAANMKLDRQLKTHEGAINQIGVVTRDSNGALLSQTEIFNNAVKTLGTYKEGVDRNEAALYLFGRGAAEAQKYLRLNDEEMQKGTQIAALFGTNSEQSALQAEKFGDDARELGKIFEAMKVALGNQLIPVVDAFIDEMKGSGPAAVEAMVTALKLLLTAMEIIADSAQEIWIPVKAALLSVNDAIYGIVMAVVKVMEGDFKGAWESVKIGGIMAYNDLNKAGQDMVNQAVNGAKIIALR